MEYLQNLYLGFSVVFEPVNLIYCFVGVLAGTLIGVLPGIGPVGAMAILLPSTFAVSPVTGIILLAGIYYGAMYGGSTTSILVNIPGEAASVVTCLDGYQMARKGRAGVALGMCAFGSFFGGTFSILVLMILALPLAEFALRFGPPEYFAIMFVGLTLITYLARGSFIKALVMVIIGLILGCVGPDIFESGTYRFAFGLDELYDGVPMVPMVMGLFGISEVLINLEKPGEISVFQTKIKHLFPTREDWKRSIGPILRGSFLGFGLGILPGGGAVLSSFVDYTMEKRISRRAEKFGTGVIEGVAGPETANNAAVGGAFIPLMAFGIPANVVMAILLGALLIHGVAPGPLFIKNHPDIFWGTVASMYLGNGMLLVLNLPLIPLWVRLLKVPYKVLFPLVLLFCLIGCYSINNNIYDLYAMAFFGVAGYVLKKLRYEFAPWILAFVLGPMLETSFRQSIILSGGSLAIFIQRPLSAVFICMAVFLLATNGLSFFRKARQKVGQVSDDE